MTFISYSTAVPETDQPCLWFDFGFKGYAIVVIVYKDGPSARYSRSHYKMLALDNWRMFLPRIDKSKQFWLAIPGLSNPSVREPTNTTTRNLPHVGVDPAAREPWIYTLKNLWAETAYTTPTRFKPACDYEVCAGGIHDISCPVVNNPETLQLRPHQIPFPTPLPEPS